MAVVSVNIPVYNGRDYLAETINSVLSQTFVDFEVIIVDDGSSDNPGEIIKNFKDSRIKYFYQNNQGIGAARNAALKNSHGDFIAFLDQDDLWLPEKLEKQMLLFRRNPGLGLVFCDTKFFNKQGEICRLYSKLKPPRGLIFRDLLRRNFLSLETVLINRKALDEVGIFKPHMMMVEEYDLFLRITHRFPADYVDEPLAAYRIHEKNYSWGKETLSLSEEREVLIYFKSNYPGFEIEFQKEIAVKERSLLMLEAFLSWKKGENEKAYTIFKKIAKSSPGIKIAVLLVLSRLLNFSIFKVLIKFFPGARKNQFLLN